MTKIEQIMSHPLYREHMMGIKVAEKERIFCKHGLEHCLDVARILYIMVLEEGLPYEKELVYAAGLLHDIGRYDEYTRKVSHHEAGVHVAEEILADCQFCANERYIILNAIEKHKDFHEGGERFCQLLYQADKLSRCCYLCDAWQECYWETERKNRMIQY